MSNPNEGFDYLCSQFKNGITVGAGLTLFISGIFIGHKVAVFVVDITKNVGNDSFHSFKQKMHDIIIEEDINTIVYK